MIIFYEHLKRGAPLGQTGSWRQGSKCLGGRSLRSPPKRVSLAASGAGGDKITRGATTLFWGAPLGQTGSWWQGAKCWRGRSLRRPRQRSSLAASGAGGDKITRGATLI